MAQINKGKDDNDLQKTENMLKYLHKSYIDLMYLKCHHWRQDFIKTNYLLNNIDRIDQGLR